MLHRSCCNSTVADSIQAGESERAQNALSSGLFVAFVIGLAVLGLLQV